MDAWIYDENRKISKLNVHGIDEESNSTDACILRSLSDITVVGDIKFTKTMDEYPIITVRI